MIDKRKLEKLANIMVNYSVELKKDEKLIIRAYGFDGYPLAKEVYKAALKAGASQVDLRFGTDELGRIFYENASDKQLTHMTKLDEKIADSYDCMIQIVADGNPYELSGIDMKKRQMVQKARKKLSDIYHKKRWVLFYYPNVSSAQTAKRNLEEWEDFVLDSCLVDWKKEEKMQAKFIKYMEKIKEVHITGEETDLLVNIDKQRWKKCCGKFNLPDGEIFTSPVRTKVNGVIKYNVPTQYSSHDFNWVKLTIKDGKVVKEESDNVKALTEILNADKGSRYFGEFAFGLNNNIKKGTKQILFDEKMGKSLHMALGKCYEEAPNGNDSTVHWDLIFKFKEAKAVIYFDGKKVYEKGKWLDKRFLFLN